VLQRVALFCTEVHNGAVCCSMLRVFAERAGNTKPIDKRAMNFCCSVLQRGAQCCTVLQCVALWCSVVQCVAVCCSVLQYVAVAIR